MEFLVVIFVLFLYFLPSLIGGGKRNAGAIFVLNLLLGWTVIGWVVALVWGCTNDETPEPRVSFGGKTCPECAETVKTAALKCRFCGHSFEQVTIIDHSTSQLPAKKREPTTQDQQEPLANAQGEQLQIEQEQMSANLVASENFQQTEDRLRLLLDAAANRQDVLGQLKLFDELLRCLLAARKIEEARIVYKQCTDLGGRMNPLTAPYGLLASIQQSRKSLKL